MLKSTIAVEIKNKRFKAEYAEGMNFHFNLIR